MRRNRLVLAALLLLSLPSVAQANAGTPLMWAGILHLVIGNLFIGILEGLLLARLFAVSKRNTIGLLILANYFSAWVGSLLLRGVIVPRLSMNLHNAWALLWLMVLITYIITLVLELPFVALALRHEAAWPRKTIRGSLVVQSVSYVVLFGWYWLASGTSLFTGTDIVELSSIPVPEDVVMYYISAADGDVYSRPLAAPHESRVYDLNSLHRNDRLLVRASAADSGAWDIIARLESLDRREPTLVTIRESFVGLAAPPRRDVDADPPRYDGTGFNFGLVPRLGEASRSPWEFWTGFWAVAGLSGSREDTHATVRFSFETVFADWRVRNATHLPNDTVLLQLGEDQICIYDPERRQIALVTEGRGQIAVIERPPLGGEGGTSSSTLRTSVMAGSGSPNP